MIAFYLPSNAQSLRELKGGLDGIVVDGVQLVDSKTNGHQDQQMPESARFLQCRRFLDLVLVDNTICCHIHAESALWVIVNKCPRE